MALNSPGNVPIINGGYSKRAYVTFLAGNGGYVKGVVGLSKGLRKVKSAYPLVVAILPDVPEEHRKAIRSQGCLVHEMEPVPPPDDPMQYGNNKALYSKLCVWNLEEYSKMIYLDADIQVFDNIDHLFDMPDGYIYAVADCFCDDGWLRTPQYSIGYCQQYPDKVTWPAEMGSPPPLYFNTGMFVFEPSRSTYQTMLKTLQITPAEPYGDQPFLNKIFSHMFKPIPLIYNLMLPIIWHHPEKVEVEKAKVVHFCARGSKPWIYTGKDPHMDREDVKMFVAKWWDIYNDELLDFKAEGETLMASKPVFPAQESIGCSANE